jgi:uncharacterized protein YaaQ
MQLWIIIVHPGDSDALLPALLDGGLDAYAVADDGGLLRQRSVTLLVAVPPGQAPLVEQLLADYAQTRTELRTAGLSEWASHQLGELAPAPVLFTIDGAIVCRLRVSQTANW